LTKGTSSRIIVNSNFGEKKMKIHVGDSVKVLRGKDAGQTGKVISVDHAKNKAVVEGINKVYKHVKPSQRNPQRVANRCFQIDGALPKDWPADSYRLPIPRRRTQRAICSQVWRIDGNRCPSQGDLRQEGLGLEVGE
jgi:hypothetical protein